MSPGPQCPPAPCTQPRSVGLCLPLVSSAPEPPGAGMRCPRAPLRGAAAPRPAECPLPGGTAARGHRCPGALPPDAASPEQGSQQHRSGAQRASSRSRRRSSLQAAILLGHSSGEGPAEVTHLKRQLELISRGGRAGRAGAGPQAPPVSTFPACPVKQIPWQGSRVASPCLAASPPLIYLLFIYLSIIHLFSGNLEAIQKALLVVLL